MDRILETAGLASVGGWFRRHGKTMHVEKGRPCANCATPLEGPWCYNCGQAGEDYHRSVWKLIGESIEGFFHADGRLWQTLPHLLMRPGLLTRDYLAGKRAPQVPPFRMFLVILLIVFFTGHLATSQKKGGEHAGPTLPPLVQTDDAEELADLREAEANLRQKVGPAAADAFASQVKGLHDEAAKSGAPAAAAKASAEHAKDAAASAVAAASDASAAADDHATAARSDAAAGSDAEHDDSDFSVLDQNFKVNLDGDKAHATGAENWLETRIAAIRKDPDRFGLILEIWAHRVAILALPVSALLLSMLFIFNRRFFVFDHLVFSMHSLSFQLILLSVIFLLSLWVGAVAWWLIVLAPVHLYKHMRGTYGISRIGTVLRMFLLWIGTVIGFTFLAMLWFYLGANQMVGH